MHLRFLAVLVLLLLVVVTPLRTSPLFTLAALDDDGSVDDAIAAGPSPLGRGVPSSMLPRIRALERAFGIGEVARRRALLGVLVTPTTGKSSNTTTMRSASLSDPADQGDFSPCSSLTCFSCGDLYLGTLGKYSSSLLVGTDGTDFYGFSMCNADPILQFSGDGFSYTCSAPNTVLCQAHMGVTYSIAYSTSTPVWTYSEGVLSYYQEGAADCVAGGVPRAMLITFACTTGSDAITSVTPPALPTASYCTWDVTIATSLVCGISADTLNPYNGGGGSSDTNRPLIIFIVVLVVVVLLELVCVARRSL